MKRFLSIFCFLLLLLIAIPAKEQLACSDSSPFFTHFVYMFAHANVLHWACNAWSVLALHNTLRWYRVSLAYVLAVLLSFLLPLQMPVIGASVIVCFFIGFIAKYLYCKSRRAFYMTIALIVLSCLLPGYAGVYHVVMFAFGGAFWFAEKWCKKTISNF